MFCSAGTEVKWPEVKAFAWAAVNFSSTFSPWLAQVETWAAENNGKSSLSLNVTMLSIISAYRGGSTVNMAQVAPSSTVSLQLTRRLCWSWHFGFFSLFLQQNSPVAHSWPTTCHRHVPLLHFCVVLGDLANAFSSRLLFLRKSLPFSFKRLQHFPCRLKWMEIYVN